MFWTVIRTMKGESIVRSVRGGCKDRTKTRKVWSGEVTERTKRWKMVKTRTLERCFSPYMKIFVGRYVRLVTITLLKLMRGWEQTGGG